MEYIYSLICPIENKIKYIGLTKNIEERYRQHKSNQLKSIRKWVLFLKKNNQYPEINILDFTDKKNGRELEKIYIEKYKNVILNKQNNENKKTFVYTIRLETELLENINIDKKELRKQITKLINNYLEDLTKPTN